MHLSFLSFFDTWKHSISPSASIDPADPWWFVSQWVLWVEMNSSYSLESSHSSHDWHGLPFFVRILRVFYTYLIISAFPCINLDCYYLHSAELQPFFCHVPSHETVMSHILFLFLVPSISLAVIIDWEATLLHASTMFFYMSPTVVAWGGSDKFKSRHNYAVMEPANFPHSHNCSYIYFIAWIYFGITFSFPASLSFCSLVTCLQVSLNLFSLFDQYSQ